MTPLQMRLAIAGGLALLVLSLLVWGLYWRGEYRELKATTVVLEDQVKILVESTRACTAGVELAKKLGDAVVGQIRATLAELKKLHVGNVEAVDRIEALIAQGTPAGAGCEKAWQELEDLRTAERKARAAP